MIVYLAGPIDDVTFHGATGWRKALTFRLAELGIGALDPTRSYKASFDDFGEWRVETIVECDMQDLADASCLVAHVPAGVQIVGTSMEIAIMKLMFNKPVFIVTDRGEGLSPWIQYHADQVFTDFDQLVGWLRGRGR